MPFSDPQADGATIQATNQIALQFGTGIKESMAFVKTARTRGLTTPVILMGYYNPVLQYGMDQLVKEVIRYLRDQLVTPVADECPFDWLVQLVEEEFIGDQLV